MISDNELAGMCSDCGAECCRYISLEIDEPTCRSDYDYIRWYLLHRGVNVFVNTEGEWCLEFKASCGNLDKNNMCTDYKNRPKICKQHGADGDCEATAKHTDDLYRHFFSNADQFDDYLNSRRNGKKRKKKVMK